MYFDGFFFTVLVSGADSNGDPAMVFDNSFVSNDAVTRSLDLKNYIRYIEKKYSMQKQ